MVARPFSVPPGKTGRLAGRAQAAPTVAQARGNVQLVQEIIEIFPGRGQVRQQVGKVTSDPRLRSMRPRPGRCSAEQPLPLGLSLPVVARDERAGECTAELLGEVKSQVVGFVYPHVEALPAEWARAVGGVAGKPDAAFPRSA
ncbi:MAG: hypothetical protein K0R38_6887, partial [Polyangiaceae bacterium]|nr:hypothetical protein [Polyangiaceae bacterium]